MSISGSADHLARRARQEAGRVGDAHVHHVAASGVVAGGYWMITNMDASSRSQGGQVFVGIAVVVALASIAGMYVSLERRLRK